jgi:CheY-like chemotaxis protein
MHILIIEDSPDDRASIRQMLLRGSDRPYCFTEAELGAAGVRACREAAGTPPDCVLLDYHLPDMDAPEVLAELRNGSEFPACPVVVLTGSDVRGGSRVLRAGAQEYISKSWWTPESLARAIERFGGRSRDHFSSTRSLVPLDVLQPCHPAILAVA